MQHSSILRSRTASVVAGAALLVALGGVSGAFAASLITSEDIKNGEVKKADIGRHAVGSGELRKGSVGFAKLTDGVAARLAQTGQPGPAGAQGPAGPAGPVTAAAPFKYAGPEWGLIDRNTIGNGDAYLRSGPSSEAFGVSVAPPLGIGSLGLRTGSGADKVAFGNQVDFAGDLLSGVSTVKYSVFTTGENNAVSPANLPNLTLEVDPNLPTSSSSYSSLVFVPEAVTANVWSEIDASTAARWYLTGAAGTATGCNQTTYCTFAQVKDRMKDATIHTVALAKGRDNAFVGAVDKLVWNTTTYDFEPFGVVESR